ncbi:MAG: hypothetical protein IJ060_11175 [Oscillospiraceae bacterium]|nr:hypothetical protein [Oscillospiraceae bacterium]
MKLFVEVYKADLSSIAEAERRRLGNEFIITYDEKEQEIRYQLNPDNILVVWFTRNDENTHHEEFYLVSSHATDAYAPCYCTTYSSSEDMVGTVGRERINYHSIPKEFYKVIKGYVQSNTREAMCVDEVMNKAIKVKRFKPFFHPHPIWDI